MNNIRLNANENPYNTVDKKSLMDSIEGFEFNRYPDKDYEELRGAIATISQLPMEQIIATNGSDELIQLLILAFSNPRNNILALEPTFSEYRKIADYLGRNYIGLEPKNDLSLSTEVLLEAIQKYSPEIIFLCTPNNPTGELLDEAFIRSILKNTDCIVALDEAYIEFSSKNNSSLLKEFDNLVIMRTLSKAYGLASLRIGYGLANKKAIVALNKCRMPFNISGISAHIATKALKSMDVDKYRNLLLDEKKKILENFDALGIEYLKSRSNFVLFKVEAQRLLYDALINQEIYIRKFKEKVLKNYLRFSIGTREENDKFIKVIEEVVLNEQN